MAVGLQAPQGLLPVDGISLASTAAGIRYQGRDDLVLMALVPGSATAAVFTRNAFRAAPVTVARENLLTCPPRYLLINAGNANAGTGQDGLRAARDCCDLVAGVAGCEPCEVLPFSTGVIGEPLPLDRFEAPVRLLPDRLSPDGWLGAATAIMTTDTVPKAISRRVQIRGRTVTLTGIAKGAGMIHPDMATMLAFVATDAAVETGLLQDLLADQVARSFNLITVDGDTSTNDACVLVATGRSGSALERDSADLDVFSAALGEVMGFLAEAIVRDGEGATKFIGVRVEQAHDEQEARTAAFTVAHSPLVKTAFFASDPNWGRILAALGRCGIPHLDVNRVSIWLDELQIVSGGAAAPGYTEAEGQRVMARDEIEVTIRLNQGTASVVVRTTDLSHEYVRINAEYRS